MDYYSELLSSSSPTDFIKILEVVQPKITANMNAWLIKEFYLGEVHRALKQMYPFKASGVDGMPPLFFQYF